MPAPLACSKRKNGGGGGGGGGGGDGGGGGGGDGDGSVLGVCMRAGRATAAAATASCRHARHSIRARFIIQIESGGAAQKMRIETVARSQVDFGVAVRVLFFFCFFSVCVSCRRSLLPPRLCAASRLLWARIVFCSQFYACAHRVPSGSFISARARGRARALAHLIGV